MLNNYPVLQQIMSNNYYGSNFFDLKKCHLNNKKYFHNKHYFEQSFLLFNVVIKQQFTGVTYINDCYLK